MNARLRRELQGNVNFSYALLLLNVAVRRGVITGLQIVVENCLATVRRGHERGLQPCRSCVLDHLTCELSRCGQDRESAERLANQLFDEVKFESAGGEHG